MLLLILPFVLLASIVRADPEIFFPICQYNLLSKYYIVYGPPLKGDNGQKAEHSIKAGHDAEEQLFSVMPLALYPTACATYGLKPANITTDIVSELLFLYNQCLFTKQFPLGLWVDIYEGLPIPFSCNILGIDGAIISSPHFCAIASLAALCEIPADPVVVETTQTTESTTFTVSTTSSETETIVSTETLTTYYVTDVTTVITQGTNTYTTVTTTTTSCSTITRTYTSSCCHNHHHCKPCKTTTTMTSTITITPTTSSMTTTCKPTHHYGPCCPPNHYLHRNKFLHGCRDCSKSDKDFEVIGDWKNAKLVKAPVAPAAPSLSYLQCNVSLNNFFLVQVVAKAAQDAQILGSSACQALGYQLANVTVPILTNLGSLFTSCNVTGIVVYNSYYAWTPLCGYLQSGVNGYIAMNDVTGTVCNTASWALCRAGPNIVNTSTVPTGPFTTETVVIVQTSTQVVVNTVIVAETVTESAIATVTATSYYPVTTTLSTTAPTTTVTSISTSVTSCCCNPVVCTTVQACCKKQGVAIQKSHKH